MAEEEKSLFPKECKVFPRNNHQFISGILVNRKRIDLPAQLPLNEHELRRCLSYANVYEVVSEEKDVLLTMKNYLLDNTDAVAAEDVPDVELNRPRDVEEDTANIYSMESGSAQQVVLNRAKDPTEPSKDDGITPGNSANAKG